MFKKSRILVFALLILMQTFISSSSLAAETLDLNNEALILANPVSITTPENIKLVDKQTSVAELLREEDGKMMLAKQWYTYKFEVDTKPKSEQPVYPIDRIEYQAALDKQSFPLERLGEYKIYFLDYKLKNYSSALALSFLDKSVVVFGSYYQLPREKVHQLAVHELGHQVDFQLMNAESWLKYREIRGLTDETIYNNWSASYEKRPQEIFAEDFRLLFGGEEAQKVSHINQELPNPNEVAGLREFFSSQI